MNDGHDSLPVNPSVDLSAEQSNHNRSLFDWFLIFFNIIKFNHLNLTLTVPVWFLTGRSDCAVHLCLKQICSEGIDHRRKVNIYPRDYMFNYTTWWSFNSSLFLIFMKIHLKINRIKKLGGPSSNGSGPASGLCKSYRYSIMI